MNYVRVVCSLCGPDKPVVMEDVKVVRKRVIPGAKPTVFSRCKKCGRQAVVEGIKNQQIETKTKETVYKEKNSEDYSRIMEKTRAELYRKISLQANDEQQKTNPNTERHQDGTE